MTLLVTGYVTADVCALDMDCKYYLPTYIYIFNYLFITVNLDPLRSL